MNRSLYTIAFVICFGPFVLLTLAFPASAFQVTGEVICDNHYAIFTGDATSVSPIPVGGGNYTPPGPAIADSYNFNTNDTHLYIAVWGDHPSDPYNLQGFLHDLSVDGVDVWSGSPQWDLYWTDYCPCADYPGYTPPVVQMDAAIAMGNANGWLLPMVGGINDGTFPPSAAPNTWQVIPGIDTNARWVWWCQQCVGVDAPFTPSYNYGEFMVYRLVMSALPVPAESLHWGAIKALYR
jgi:hypothetical protein